MLTPSVSKKVNFWAYGFLFVCLPCYVSCSQEPQEVLRNLASNDAEVRMSALRQASALDENHLADILALISQDDYEVSKTAKSALKVIVTTVGASQEPTKRQKVTEKLIELLQGDLSTETKREVLRALALIPDETNVPCLADFLRQPDLAEDAKAALERIPSDSATKTLLDYLPNASLELQRSILGSLKHKAPFTPPSELMELARNPASENRWAALDVLAACGLPPFEFVTQEEYSNLEDHQKNRFAVLSLNAAERLVEQGKKDNAEKIYLQTLSIVDVPYLAAGVLDGLMRMQSREAVILALRWVVEPDLMNAAVNALINSTIPDLDSQLTAAFLRDTGFRKAQILRVLAHRHTDDFPKILDVAAKDTSAEVRLAAAEIAGTLPEVKDFREAFATGAVMGKDNTARFAIQTASRLIEQGNNRQPVEIAELVIRAQSDLPFLAEAFRIIAHAATPDSIPLLSEIFGMPYTGFDPNSPGTFNQNLARAFEKDSNLKALAEKAYVASCANADAETAVSTLKNVVERSGFPEVVMAAGVALQKHGINTTEIAAKQGYLTFWRVIGPFPNEDNRNVNVAFLPENSSSLPESVEYQGVSYTWKPLNATGIPAIADLKAAFEKHEKSLAYASAIISVPSETKAILSVGSDDGGIVWINGGKVVDKPAPRKLVVNEDRAEITLKEGENVLLVKVTQGVGDWLLCVRLTDSTGSPLNFTLR